MPAQIRIARGDKNKLTSEELKNGQLFWEYANKSTTTSNGHTYSLGDLYIKQNGELVKITSTRSNGSLKIVGSITKDFDGDFTKAKEDTIFRRCQEGDVFLIESVAETNSFKYSFEPNDFLIITKAEYEAIENGDYTDTLKEVDYIRVPSSYVKSDSDLEAETVTDAISELEIRLNYKGELYSLKEYYDAEKKKGNMFLLKAAMVLNSDQVTLSANAGRKYAGNYVKARYGDFIFWNGTTWTLIPSGLVPSDIPVEPDTDKIDAVETFETYHKNLLKNCTNLQEVIDTLFTEKAPLDHNHKIPYSVLPDSVTTGLSYWGKFYPVVDVEGDKDDESNQNDWPVPTNEYNEVLEERIGGSFYIVDCKGLINVQYKDKTITNRIIELNTGDWVVWNDKTEQFEVIDNSDRISAINVKTANGTTVTLLGTLGMESASDDIKLSVDENTIIIDMAGKVCYLDEEGIKNHLSKFNGTDSLVNTNVTEEGGKLTIEDYTEIGTQSDSKTLGVYGDVTVGWSAGETLSSYKNHCFNFSSKFENSEGELDERLTQLVVPEYGEDKKAAVVLPETSSYVIYKYAQDALEKNYLPIINGNNSITDSMVNVTRDKGMNVGEGQITAEYAHTHKISFYGEVGDEYDGGFYETTREIKDPTDSVQSAIEVMLNRDGARTDLSINPFVLSQNKVTDVILPRVSGNLITMHEILNLMGDLVGEDLMLPSFRADILSNGEIVMGLGKTPVRMRINENITGLGTKVRTNDLSKEYGSGKLQTAWSYIMSDHSGSTQESAGDQDILTFDAWMDVQRSVASKEAFVLPSTVLKDTARTWNLDEQTPSGTAGETIDYTGSGKGFHTRVVPSKTAFPNDEAYFNVYGKEIKQEVAKTVELPAESGVLATHNSLLRSPTYF